MILHVLESYGAGVGVAVQEYVASTPNIEHRLLVNRRTEDLADRPGIPVYELPSGHMARVAAVRQLARRLRPTIVHAHSSFGGLYARIAVRTIPIAYSPHCFAMERRDVPGTHRAAYRLVERMLRPRTAAYAVVSEREARISQSLGASERQTRLIPHAAPAVRPRTPVPSRPLSVCAVGRVGPQKDPAFFAEVAKAALSQGVDVSFRWIGDGDANAVEMLRRSGVEVTGWCERERTLDLIAASDILLHTAAWEGFPICVVEAAALDLGIIVRPIPAFEGTDLTACSDPGHAVRLLKGSARSSAGLQRLRAANDRITTIHSREQQRSALTDLYASISEPRD